MQFLRRTLNTTVLLLLLLCVAAQSAVGFSPFWDMVIQDSDFFFHPLGFLPIIMATFLLAALQHTDSSPQQRHGWVFGTLAAIIVFRLIALFTLGGGFGGIGLMVAFVFDVLIFGIALGVLRLVHHADPVKQTRNEQMFALVLAIVFALQATEILPSLFG